MPVSAAASASAKPTFRPMAILRRSRLRMLASASGFIRVDDMAYFHFRDSTTFTVANNMKSAPLR